MSRWIEVPAHRVLEVDWLEFKNQFEILNEHGKPVGDGEAIGVIRRKDGRLFRIPRYHAVERDFAAFKYLEEAE